MARRSISVVLVNTTLVLLVLLTTGPLFAKTYHVTPKDKWIQILNDRKALKPGDELVFGEGTYDPGERSIRVRYRGTERKPIVVRAAEGAKVHFTRKSDQFNMFDLLGTRYLTIKGLELTGGSTVFRIQNDGRQMTKFLTLDGNHIHHTKGLGITANTPGSRYRGLHFVNNNIHHTGAEGEAFYLGCNDDQCQFFDSVIERNYIHDLVDDGNPRYQGDGIEIKQGSYNNIIRDNVIVNTNYPGITVYGVKGKGNGKRNIIEGNVLLNVKNHGIQSAADAIIRNNVILGSELNGIHIQPHQGAIPGNLDIVNNTIRADVGGKDNCGIRIMPFKGFSGPILLANNAIYMASEGEAIRMRDAPDDHPVTSIGNIGTDGSVHETTVVPFDSSGSLADDFVDLLKLDAFPKVGSKLIGAGSAEHQPAEDFNSSSRSESNDVGAYRFHANGNPGWKVVPGVKGL